MLLTLLDRQGRMTARELAEELEVSPRTILRDIEALSGIGVPVYAVRGPRGGFELLGGRAGPLAELDGWARPTPSRARQRIALRITEHGVHLAARLGSADLAQAASGVGSAADGSFSIVMRVTDTDLAARQLLALAGEVEVIEPDWFRTRLLDLAQEVITPSRRAGS